MAITAAGVGSGLDIEGIVTQLMQLERRPLDVLQQRVSDTRAELSAYGRLKSSVSKFKSAMDGLSSVDKFQVYAATSSDKTVVTASAGSGAAKGVYSIDVQRLAQNHKQSTAEFSAGSEFGTGGDTLTLAVGTGSMDVAFSGAMTLEQLRDAVNNADDNPGITASILNTGGGNQRLILTSQASGEENQIALSYTGSIAGNPFGFATANRDDLGDPITDLDQLNAQFTVDGFPVTTPSNQPGEVITGLSLNLHAVGKAELSVDRDTATIRGSMQTFVDAYNTLQNTIKDLAGDELSGDGVLRSIQTQLRGVMNTAPTGLDSSFNSLGELGVATQKDGTLSFDAEAFEDALVADFSGVAQLLANDDQGYAFRFAALADNLGGNKGLIDTREDSLNDRISDLGKRQDNWEYRLELTEQRLRSQYASLDSLVGQLQSTSNFLFQQLGI